MTAWTPTPGTYVTSTVRLERPLGRGGMGSVWLAAHITLQTHVAVKFISTDVPPSALPGLLSRFEREARAAAKIRSPHVVDVRDFGTIRNGVPFLVMELLEGESLAQALAGPRRLPLAMVSDIVTQAAKGLGAAHALGIRHRDIKPDNLFLVQTHDGLLVKLLDFGIAKTDDLEVQDRALTATTAVLGTPDYMSPEQLLAPKTADHRVDLWGLAVVAYEALTGRLPFQGETIGALSVAVQSGSFPLPSAINHALSAGVDAWFARSLHPDPAARFRDAKEFAESFRAAASGPGAPSALSTVPMGISPLAGGIPGMPYAASAETRLDQPVSAMAGKVPAPSAPRSVAHPSPSSWPAPPNASGRFAPVTIADADVFLSEEQTVVGKPALALAQAPLPSGAALPTLQGSSHTVSNLLGPAPPPRKPTSPQSARQRNLVIGLGVTALALIGVMLGLLAGEEPTASSPARATASSTAAAATPSRPPSRPAPEGMVVVPGGRHEIGCSAGVPECRADSQPKHAVELGPFALLAKEITMEQYDVCVGEGKCPPPGKDKDCTWQREGKESFPINCVAWAGANAYCTAQGWRLPTEAEWEVAARGPRMTDFPWGPQPLAGFESLALRAVGTLAGDKSWVGGLDLASNVREWTATEYAAYPSSTTITEKRGKVVRGGSWRTGTTAALMTHARGAEPTDKSDADLGFRCAVSL